MDTWSALASGFTVALTPQNLLWALAAVTLGTAVGVLPGIGRALTVALLLPITYSLDPTAAFHHVRRHLLRRHVRRVDHVDSLEYAGRKRIRHDGGGGTSDGACRTRGPALATAAIGSFVAGTLGTIALTVSAPFMVRLALRFGPAEYFALAALAFVMVSSVLGDSRLHGYVSLLFGLLLGLIGIDPLSGEPRLSFGIPQLLDGLDVVVVAVGLFAVEEALHAASRVGVVEEITPLRGSVWMTRVSGRGPGSRGCEARQSDFLLARCRRVAPRFRRSSRTRWSGNWPTIRASSATAPLRESPLPRPPITLPRPARWYHSSLSVCRRRRLPRSC